MKDLSGTRYETVWITRPLNHKLPSCRRRARFRRLLDRIGWRRSTLEVG